MRPRCFILMPKKVRRLIFGTVLAIVVLAIAAVLLIPHFISTDWARQKIETALEERTGRDAEVGEISFGWRRGLTAHDVTIHQKNAADEKLGPLFRFSRLSLSAGLRDLLDRRLVFDSVTVDKPLITVIRDAKGRLNFADLLDPSSRLPDFVATIEANEGRVLFVDRKVGTRFVADRAHADITWTKGQVELESDFALNGGASTMTAHADFRDPDAPFTVEKLSVKGASLDVNLAHLGFLIPVAGLKPENASGTFSLELTDLHGRGDSPIALRGHGSIDVSASTLLSGPMIAVYERVRPFLKNAPALRNMTQAITSKFKIGGGRVETDELKVGGEGFDLRMAGWTNLSGALDYTVEVDQLPELARFFLRGTLSNPKVSLDEKPLLEVARKEAEERVREEVDKRAKEVLEDVKREIGKKLPKIELPADRRPDQSPVEELPIDRQ